MPWGFHISYLGEIIVVAVQPVRGRRWRGIGREAMMLFLFHEIRGDINGAWKRGTHAVVAKLRISTMQPARGRVHRRWGIGRKWMKLLLLLLLFP